VRNAWDMVSRVISCREHSCTRTFCDFLSSINLRDLLLQKLVTTLADRHNLRASNTELCDILQNLLGNGGGTLVLGEGIWVIESVVCPSSMLAYAFQEGLKPLLRRILEFIPNSGVNHPTMGQDWDGMEGE
jgi:hypothetical protein